MLKSSSRGMDIYLSIENPYSANDINILLYELSKEWISYHIEFGDIYVINDKVIDSLYDKLYIQKKNVKLTTHTLQLNQYLKNMGLKPCFEPFTKEYLINANIIEVIIISCSGLPKNILEIVQDIHFQNLALVILENTKKKEISDEVLQRYTDKEIVYIKNIKEIQKGSISLTNDDLTCESFSEYYKEKLVVLNAGTSTNETEDALGSIKNNNSLMLIQDSSECETKVLRINPSKSDLYDYVFTRSVLIQYINFLNKKANEEIWIEYLLYTIYEKYAYDLRMYHRGTIQRRLDIFMIKHSIKNIKNAVGIILFNAIAFKSFFLDIAINVTEFFRKPQSFEYILDVIHVKYKNIGQAKIWSAGCSSGEEVYSLAIALESLGYLERSIIYATDFNEVVLQEAKNAIYTTQSLQEARENLSKISHNINFNDYIQKNKHYFKVNDKIKEKIVFFEHNLATDTSFNEFDIIICQNVIIYFDSILQEKVLQLFYDSLKFGGYLVLGESEELSEKIINKFQRHNKNCKIYQKVA